MYFTYCINLPSIHNTLIVYKRTGELVIILLNKNSFKCNHLIDNSYTIDNDSGLLVRTVLTVHSNKCPYFYHLPVDIISLLLLYKC